LWIFIIFAFLNPNENDFDSPDEGFTSQNKISRSDKSAGSWGLEDQANDQAQRTNRCAVGALARVLHHSGFRHTE